MEEGFERLAPPRRGEWRSLFHEKEQTFEDYVARCANRRSDARPWLLLQPLGDPAPRVDRMAGSREVSFARRGRLRPARPLGDRARAPPPDQHTSSMLRAARAALAPADALVLLGIAGRDLFARGKKFVFGEGSL